MTTTITDPAAVAAAAEAAKVAQAAQAAEAAKVAEAAAAAAKAPKFSQEDLDHHIAQAKVKARESGVKEFLETLGVEDLEAAKATLAAAKAAAEAQKTDLQKATEALAALTKERDEAKAGTVRALATASLEGALRDAGCNAGRVAAALKLVERAGITVTGDVVTGAADAVAILKAEVPELFGTTKPGGGAADASAGGVVLPPEEDITKGMTASERADWIKKNVAGFDRLRRE